MTAAAAPRQRVVAQARFEALSLLRNGEQLLVSLVLPALALGGLAYSSAPALGTGRRIDLAVPGVLALAVVSTAFTGQAIATGFDRRYGVLRLLGSSPLGRGGLLGGKALAVLAVVAVQYALLAVLGLALGWHPRVAGIPAACLTALLGTWAFVALALALAGTLRAEAVLGLANLVWVLLLGLGVLVPTARLPSLLGPIARVLPSGALGDGLRQAFTQVTLPWWQWAVLTAWAGAGTLAARRWFRWGD